jgi:protein TonB
VFGHGKGLELKSASEHKKKPNRLLQGMIVVSLLIHGVIFMHIAGIYRSKALTFIELSVRDFSKPPGREIPRPRMRSNPPEIRDPKQIHIPKPHAPRIPMDRLECPSASRIAESIGVPQIPGVAGDAGRWQTLSAGDYMSRGDYFDMVRMKIESRKKYPDAARRRQIEGRVEVEFTLEPDGNVVDATVIKTSRHPDLDRAALLAVRDAAPFPRPPGRLFDGPLRMTITIMFELM